MASNFQQQARQRKLVYAGLILVLFTGAFVLRGSRTTSAPWTLQGQAADLAIREQSRGEVELSGAVVRLTLTGLRGLATCLLWSEAQDQQKKNQWNELEVTVRSVAKLQPHFVTPWLFQSWNLAYNVSVESDRVNDKYFYITRGIELLSEGERQNRDNPDLRWSIGFYNMHKIGQSDETNVLRSLYQLSYVPPTERDPARFWVNRGGKQEVNLVEFEKFCQNHPQLVRRLKEGIHRETELDRKRQFSCQTPEAVVRFLADNRRVPSTYEDVPPAPLYGWQDNPALNRVRKESDPDRFPVLPPSRVVQPPQHPFEWDTLTITKELRDEDDAYAVSQAWYAYAQEPIPDPDEMPGSTQPVVDRTRQHKPRYMMTVIFRQYPAQAARFMAERLQEEGWFDAGGWDIGEWFPEDRFANGGPARVGDGRQWSLDAWKTAYDMWKRHGEKNHLLLPENELANYEEQAKKFREKYHLAEGALPPTSLRPETLDAETREQLHAVQFLRELGTHRQVSNFLHHYHRSDVEARPETVQARKLFYEAEALRLSGAPARALDRYNEPGALPAWREILLQSKDFRRDTFNQEEAFEVQLRYLALVNEVNGTVLNRKGAQLMPSLLPAAGAGAVPTGLAGWLALVIPGKPADPGKPTRWSSVLLGGPFDGVDEEGVPLIGPNARVSVLQRRHQGPPQTAPAQPGGPGPQQASPPAPGK